jgi:hypothetical protein
MWHGLIPKLVYRSMDERLMLAQAGMPLSFLPWIGGLEIAVGLLYLVAWRWRGAFVVNAAAMVLATVTVAVNSPLYLRAAFNPVTLNLGMVALSVVGWLAAKRLPTARNCLRKAPVGQP